MDINGKSIDELLTKYPLSEPSIIGEKNQKEFISLFGAILRMRNLLSSFDEFAGDEILTERDMQNYLGRYQDLYDEWKRKREKGELENINDDIVFEIELVKQIEINIDYILMLVKKYHDSNCGDKEILVDIRRAVDSSPELRSKKGLIETFIARINEVSDVLVDWKAFVLKQKEDDLDAIIREEQLKPEITRRIVEDSFRDGELNTNGTEFDAIMPAMSLFGGGKATKKQTVIERLKAFFTKYFGIV